MPPRFGVDHNFPEPILEAIRGYLPFGVEMIKEISPLLIANVDDWQVLLALAQQGYHGLISLDFEAIALPKEMAVVHQTNLTVVAIEAAGDNPLRAVGQLLIHATHIEKAYRADEPQVFQDLTASTQTTANRLELPWGDWRAAVEGGCTALSRAPLN